MLLQQDSDHLEQLEHLDDEVVEATEQKRPNCEKCSRPTRVCWCSHVPNPPLKLKRTKIIVLQHPNEVKRAIRTAKMLEEGLEDCSIYVRRKILSLDIKDSLSDEEKELRTWLKHPKAYVLYPQYKAVTPEDLAKTSETIVLIVLDGTWNEAQKMYAWSPPLQKLPKIRLNLDIKSQFVVKTQPNDKCLSTVECVAHALSTLEKNEEMVELLTKPLLALCSVQISHGALKHDSLDFKRDVETFKKENVRRSGKA